MNECPSESFYQYCDREYSAAMFRLHTIIITYYILRGAILCEFMMMIIMFLNAIIIFNKERMHLSFGV